ncbi:polysaccharide deacetylase family protein [Desulfurobacterium sp. TC5-1]|uniref:polysaccharide deacetylase family protein n=1 Tax=Desulfurobacterium sp. TC5-1 TaxID=1158318 RepID=UPI0003B5D336|nr:polysaccharide deacetylase family protein [Desulfurobacterium sp. TC5-1]
MNREKNTSSLKERIFSIFYLPSALLVVFMFSISSTVVVYNLLGVRGSIPIGHRQNRKVGILFLNESQNWYSKVSSKTKYKNRLSEVKEDLLKLNIKSDIIKIEDLKNYPIVFVIDSPSISKEHRKALKEYLKNGGHILITWFSGFYDENFNKVKPIIEEFSDAKFKNIFSPGEKIFVAPKILNPITFSLHGKRAEIVLYDPMPLFSSAQARSSLLPCSWSMLPHKTIGTTPLMFYGFYGNGSFVYTTFPYYSLKDIKGQDKYFMTLLKNIYNFLSEKSIAVPFPFIDIENPTVIETDAEYEIENLKHFENTLRKFRIKGTAFILSSLANRVSSNLLKSKNIEIGSHFTEHIPLTKLKIADIETGLKKSKEILEKLSGKKVTGFRPPEESIPEHLTELLKKTDYRYLLSSAEKTSIYPHMKNGIVVIPRNGNDDFYFTIKSNKLSAEEFLKEESFIHTLNSVYILSLHTEIGLKEQSLLSSFIEKSKNTTFTTCKKIAEKVRLFYGLNTKLTISSNGKAASLKIVNRNPETVKKMKVRIFWNKKGISVVKAVSEIVGQPSPEVKNYQTYTDITLKEIKPASSQIFYLTLASNGR